jgi:transcription elongation factor GreA
LEPNGHTTLIQAFGQYVSKHVMSMKGDKAETSKELQRFVQWCGPHKVMGDVTPSMIGDYVERVIGSGTTPQAPERLQAVRQFLSFAHKEQIIERKLAQHVRVRRVRPRFGTGSLQEDSRIQLTEEGHEQLVAELESLKARRPELSEAIRLAAADKDVRENAPLEAAREDAGRVQGRISEIEQTLNNSVVMDAAAIARSRVVKLGAVVSVLDLSPERRSSQPADYTVVSASEVKPPEKISDVSPLGGALLGRSVGHEVDVQTPRGMMKYKILGIS